MSAYSDRNGETIPPENDGYYWMEDDRYPNYDKGFRKIVEVRWYLGDLCRADFSTPIPVGSYKTLRWWGPIVPPWEQP